MNDNEKLIDGLVSVIMPAYNTEAYIRQSVKSVQLQTYENWELLIVDDKSTDNTVNIIKAINDPRIKLIQLETNQGAAYARNAGVEKAQGEFLAFLDGDDLWTKDKLEQQIQFMKENDYVFTCTEFAEIVENNKIQNIVQVQDELDYMGVLKNSPGNSTIIYNAKILGKFYAPLIRKRNDFAMWLQVIKAAGKVHGLKEVHTIYRVRENSLSFDKKSLVKYQWKVYREIENLSLLTSSYLLFNKIVDILVKRYVKN